jgi:dipeptidyl aminopeptidase/acylaminoacyl peptidase
MTLSDHHPAASSDPRLNIARYLNVRSAYFPAFCGNDRLAFLTDITGVPQVWLAGLPGRDQEPRWPDQLTFADDRVLGVWASPAGPNSLLFTRDFGGNEKAQLWLLDPDTGAERCLTAGHEEAMHGFGCWSGDGRSFLFSANRRHPGLFDLYRQPLDGPAELVWQNDDPGFLPYVAWSPDSRHAVVSLMRSSFDNDLLEIDLATGTARRLNPTEVQARYSHQLFTRDGRLLMLTDVDSDFMYLARLDLDSLALQRLTTVDRDFDLMALSPDGRKLACTLNIDGATELHLHDLETGRDDVATLQPTPGVVGMMDWQLTFSPDSQMLAFSYTAATRASDCYIWAVDDPAAAPIAVTHSAHAGLDPAAFTSPRLIHYPTFDQGNDGRPRHIPAWLYSGPLDPDQPRPVVILVHGGPESQFQPYFHPFVQYFAAYGYAVLAPNVRGSTGYGKAYSHLDDVDKRLDSVADLAHAVYWLRQQPGIDGRRIAIDGGSYGGFMVLAALTFYPDLWAAGANFVGISNFVTFLENTSDYRRAHREAEYGRLDRDRELLERISPLNHVDKIQAPLIVIHGANDPRVPLTEAEQLVAAVKERGVPVEFLVFDDEGHGIAMLANKLVAYPAVADFFARHV